MAVRGRTKMSADDVERLATLLDEGKSRSSVAREMGISESGVYYLSIKAGRGTRRVPGSGVNKLGRRRFSSEEDRRISELRISGMTIKSIGEAVGRHPSSVFMRLQALASHEESDEG